MTFIPMTATPSISPFSFLEDVLCIKIDLNAEIFSNKNYYNLWAQKLFAQNNPLDGDRVFKSEYFEGEDSRCFDFYLQLSQLLFYLGRLPVFDIPRVVSLNRDSHFKKKCRVEIELLNVSFVPQAAYQIVMKSALKLCKWMVENPPGRENNSKVFNAINEEVIKPLWKIVPAGKSTMPILKAAHSLGIPFLHIGAGVYQLGWGSKARRMDRSTTELDSSMGAKLTRNKAVTANLLRLAGLPAPTHFIVSNEAEALAAADRLGFPIVIKPSDRDRGEGVSVDIFDTDTVKSAFTHAHELSRSRQAIVERQVAGVCHRLFIANGRLLYAVKRLPMSVVGDGRHTIAQLVNNEVSAQRLKAPWTRSEIQPIDDRAINALASAGLSPESIPAEGVFVALRRIESTADGGVDEDVTHIVHPDNLSAAITCAKLFGLHIAGIDVISPDISRPWHENGAIINEVNYAPLFGGGEISRSYIPNFFAAFIDGDGKIPIENFDDEELAMARQEAHIQTGMRCYFTTSTNTIDSSKNPLIMPFIDIGQRLRALICRSDVDAIVFCLPRSSDKSSVSTPGPAPHLSTRPAS